MSICPSNPRTIADSRLLWWAVVLMIGPAPLFAQQPQLSGPQFPLIPAPVQSPVQVEYWIASSRECRQRHQTNCPQGTLRYFAVDTENRLTDLPEATFLGSLDYSLPICFVIHGDMTSFENLRRSAPSIVKWLRAGAGNQPVQFVFYTWPSDDEAVPIPPVSITARGERAEFNGCYLADLISKFPAHCRISFFGHSFGSRVAAATLHLLAGGTIPGCRFRCHAGTPRRYRAVFIAAAMDRPWLNPGERYGRALLVTEWLFNLRNGADFVINLYPIRTLFGRQALGRVGFSPGDRLRMGPLASRISEWDVTMKIRTAHAWAYYYSRLEIAAVIAPVLVYSDHVATPTVRALSQRTTRSDSKPPVLSPSILFRGSSRTNKLSAMRIGL